ncbi:MAG: LysM peptidoglycan-binding domain-containing protein [Chloroflexota bacterium]
MTAVDPQTRTLAPAVPSEVAVARPLTRICPYLAAADGAWRSSTATREHRCGAVTPPAPLATEKQRRLCLTPDYGSCTTFEAARAARPLAHDRAPTLPRPLARTTPIVLDHGRIAITVPAWQSERSMGQAILIALMALAFAAIVLAKMTGGSAPAGGIDASPSAHGAAGASNRPSPAGPTAVTSTDPGGSPAATPVDGSSAAPGGTAPPDAPATRSYKVKAGDTLIGIANKFGTTPKAIQRLNGITDPSSLKTGQVLKIP